MGFVSVMLLFSMACSSADKQIGATEFGVDYSRFSAKKQMAYFNGLTKEQRLKFLVEMMNAGKAFRMPPVSEIKFDSNGEFVADVFINGKGYLSETQEGSPRPMIGKWAVENGDVVFLSVPKGFESIAEGDRWVDIKATLFQNKEVLLLPMVLSVGATEPEEDTLHIEEEFKN